MRGDTYTARVVHVIASVCEQIIIASDSIASDSGGRSIVIPEIFCFFDGSNQRSQSLFRVLDIVPILHSPIHLVPTIIFPHQKNPYLLHPPHTYHKKMTTVAIDELSLFGCWHRELTHDTCGICKNSLNEQAPLVTAADGSVEHFAEEASEERIWRDACELKAGTRRERTKKTESGKKHDLRIAKAPSPNPDSVPKETRKILRIVRELFQGSVNDDVSAVALNRAKLRSICGDYQSNPGPDRKKWKLSSWYYLGLHHDAIGEIYSSKACMKMALRQGGLASGNGSDFINVLPMLHMTIRDWFDDDLYEEDIYSPAGVVDSDDKPLVCVKDSDEKSKGLHSAKKGRGSDASNASAPQATEEGTQQSAARAAIQASLENVNLASLREALRKRGMKTSGSKAALQQRLLHALLEDIGL